MLSESVCVVKRKTSKVEMNQVRPSDNKSRSERSFGVFQKALQIGTNHEH